LIIGRDVIEIGEHEPVYFSIEKQRLYDPVTG